MAVVTGCSDHDGQAGREGFQAHSGYRHTAYPSSPPFMMATSSRWEPRRLSAASPSVATGGVACVDAARSMTARAGNRPSLVRTKESTVPGKMADPVDAARGRRTDPDGSGTNAWFGAAELPGLESRPAISTTRSNQLMSSRPEGGHEKMLRILLSTAVSLSFVTACTGADPIHQKSTKVEYPTSDAFVHWRWRGCDQQQPAFSFAIPPTMCLNQPLFEANLGRRCS